jgi:hypothetical protein
MSRHPVDGVRGSKPRVLGVKSAEKGNGKVSKAELSRLSREYLAARNRAQAAKAEAAEIALAEKKGTLISLRLARLQLSYLLTVHRQRMLAAPAAWGPRCVGLPDEHAAAQVLREMALAWLADLQDLPARVTDPDWLEHIGDEEEGAPERRPTPEQAGAAAAKAKARREKRNTAQRRSRGRARLVKAQGPRRKTFFHILKSAGSSQSSTMSSHARNFSRSARSSSLKDSLPGGPNSCREIMIRQNRGVCGPTLDFDTQMPN